ncbi:membrane protein (plasmid) [Rhodovulum sp. P5]|nr:membrane protein [Rhodovulum sp. P5]
MLISLVGGFLLLPPNIVVLNLPLLPPVNKDTVPALMALAILLSKPSREKLGFLPTAPIPLLLLVFLVAGAFLTALTNGDTVISGGRVLPGIESYDAFSDVLIALMMLLPFFFAHRFLAATDLHRLFLNVLVIAGLVYSLPALFEVRMSPQLNMWIYGYFPHEWIQHVRENGFRPVVFLKHGLWLSTFFSLSTLAAAGLARFGPETHRRRYLLAMIWLLITLVLTKSFGAVLITLLLVPPILFLGLRGQFLVAAFFSAVVLLYPMLRAVDVVPTEQIIETVETVAPDRSRSLAFRVRNEDMLLAKADERALFGWGGWGRQFIYGESGQSETISDGTWIVVMGRTGWTGYLGTFGLLTLPVILMAFRHRRFNLAPETAILAMILVANLIDLIPNSSITVLTWMMAGALWGRLALGTVTAEETSPADTPPQPSSPYSRQFRRRRRGGLPEPDQAAISADPPDPAPTGKTPTGKKRPVRHSRAEIIP